MTEFATYIPRATGYAPANWRDGMPWAVAPEKPELRPRSPAWIAGTVYVVPLHCLESEAARKLRVQQLVDAAQDALDWLNTLAETVEDPVVKAALASDKVANLQKALDAVVGHGG